MEKLSNPDDESEFQAKLYMKISTPRLPRPLLQQLIVPIVPCMLSVTCSIICPYIFKKD